MIVGHEDGRTPNGLVSGEDTRGEEERMARDVLMLLLAAESAWCSMGRFAGALSPLGWTGLFSTLSRWILLMDALMRLRVVTASWG